MQILEKTPEMLTLHHRRVVRPWITGFFVLLFLAMAFLAHADAPGII
jgi:hypothetical protein